MIRPAVKHLDIVKVKNGSHHEVQDLLAVEEPLEIRLGFGPVSDREQRSLAITMRTPGHDFELVTGFLFTEGIIKSAADFTRIAYCRDKDGKQSPNIVRVELQPTIELDWDRFSRHFYTNSSCGICGKASIESLEGMCESAIESNFSMSAEVLHSLDQKMRKAQGIFDHTGALHAAALFNENGELLHLREDIGRHNALDKVIGTALTEGSIPLTQHVIMLSGRSCFELIQKALMSRIPIVAAVGAPSSLAAETAQNFKITLLGFAKNNGFNIYSAPEKIRYETAHS
ncbi:MAG: formate dehydrogenase accessory sulfurtransferase FdhD [Saprospiraceae bacterium]